MGQAAIDLINSEEANSDAASAAAVNEDKLAQIDDEVIQKAFADMDAIGAQRESLNADMEKVKADLAKLGIPRNAINAAYSRYKTDSKKLEKFDAAYLKCLNAVNKGFQTSLI